MKAVFALFHDYNFQPRPPELISALRLMGVDDIVLVTYTQPEKLDNAVRCVITKNGSLRYFWFVRQVLKTIKKEKPEIVLLHDNTCASILGSLVKRKYKGRIIYDSSELYIEKNKVTSPKQYLIQRRLPRNEKKYIGCADAVIAANAERAAIMKDYFGLEKTPLVLENIRRIELDYDSELCQSKYGDCFPKGKFSILYGGGVSAARRTVELAETVNRLGNEYSLTIIGGGSSEEILKLNELIASSDIKNVRYLGKVPRNEWKYLLTVADANVAVYTQDTANSKYCASGRFYEGLLEGTPVIASENPPMKNACEKYGFGVSNDDLRIAITTLKDNYAKYKENAIRFSETYGYAERIPKLADELTERLGQSERNPNR